MQVIICNYLKSVTLNRDWIHENIDEADETKISKKKCKW